MPLKNTRVSISLDQWNTIEWWDFCWNFEVSDHNIIHTKSLVEILSRIETKNKTQMNNNKERA